MPGAGKSTLGKALAKRLDLTFIDADTEMVRRCGVPIATIFEVEGEAGFREREAHLIAELVQRPNIVLATGGGVILREENRQQLRANGTVIYLHADPADLLARTLRDTKRPLLQGSDHEAKLAALFAAREAHYLATAHITIEPARASVRAVIAQTIAALDALQTPDNQP